MSDDTMVADDCILLDCRPVVAIAEPAVASVSVTPSLVQVGHLVRLSVTSWGSIVRAGAQVTLESGVNPAGFPADEGPGLVSWRVRRASDGPWEDLPSLGANVDYEVVEADRSKELEFEGSLGGWLDTRGVTEGLDDIDGPRGAVIVQASSLALEPGAPSQVPLNGTVTLVAVLSPTAPGPDDHVHWSIDPAHRSLVELAPEGLRVTVTGVRRAQGDPAIPITCRVTLADNTVYAVEHTLCVVAGLEVTKTDGSAPPSSLATAEEVVLKARVVAGVTGQLAWSLPDEGTWADGSHEGLLAGSLQSEQIMLRGTRATPRLRVACTFTPEAGTAETVELAFEVTAAQRPYGYELELGDADATKKWGGQVRADNATYVGDLQRDLVKLGYWISDPGGTKWGKNDDGGFGKMVEAAVRLFQREHGLTETAKVNDETATLLRSIAGRDGRYARPGHVTPGHGRFVQLPPSANDTYSRYDPRYDNDKIMTDNWGTVSLLDLVEAGATSWKAAGRSILFIGDISNYDGGVMAPHHTHQDGTSADVDHDVACSIDKATFSKERALELADMFTAAGAGEIYFNCKYVVDKGTRVYALSPHHHHMHVTTERSATIHSHVDQECLHCKKSVYDACNYAQKRARTAAELTP